MNTFSNRKIGLGIAGWSILAIVLFLIIPMLYPAKLPLDYHIYHFILFLSLFGIYYINVRVVIPKTIRKSINLPYILLFLGMGLLTVVLMSFVETKLSLQEEVYKSLYPDKTFIASDHKSYVNYYVFFLTSIVLVIGFTNFLIKKWNAERQDKLILQDLKSQAELMNLKAQINPHFFFNTLNTIYALTHKDIKKSQKAILKLSKIMRFAMNKDNNEFVNIQDELSFLLDYLDLISYRLPSTVILEYDIAKGFPDVKIAPMVLLTFVENCFHHGISTDIRCVIKISAHFKRDIFILKTENPWFKNRKEHKGIGIENTIKRLDILYKDAYVLNQNIIDGKYITTLKINLNGN